MISTQMLTEASALFNTHILTDSVQIYTVGDPVTSGVSVSRSLQSSGDAVNGLVQTTVLENAIESQVETSYSVKVPRGTALSAGQAVKVVTCVAEPALVGKTLYIDKVSENGAAMLRKATARDFEQVNQEGKGGL